MLLRGSFAAPQPQNTHKRTQKVWLDSRTAPHPVQYTRTPCIGATARCVSFIHSPSVASRTQRSGERTVRHESSRALCSHRTQTSVAQRPSRQGDFVPLALRPPGTNTDGHYTVCRCGDGRLEVLRGAGRGLDVGTGILVGCRTWPTVFSPLRGGGGAGNPNCHFSQIHIQSMCTGAVFLSLILGVGATRLADHLAQTHRAQDFPPTVM